MVERGDDLVVEIEFPEGNDETLLSEKALDAESGTMVLDEFERGDARVIHVHIHDPVMDGSDASFRHLTS